MSYVLLVIFGSLLPIATAFAESPSASSQNSTVPSFGGLGLLLAYLTRRRPIGGWLFYYYMQLYLSLLFTLVLVIPYVGYLNPTKWGRTDLYVWYLFTVVPPLISQGAEVLFGTHLLRRRTENNVRRLRIAIASLLVTTAISLAIDLKFFNDGSADVGGTITLDVITLFFSAVWLAYFYQSVRVRRVFIEHNWAYLEPPPKTPRERQYLRNRALLWAALLYLAGFVLIGLSEGQKKPDPAMLFIVPVFYALIAALISYLCPISKKKRDTLLAPDAPKNVSTV